MKRKLHTYILALLAVGSLSLGACSKDDDGGGGSGGSGGGGGTGKTNNLEATIDSKAFNYSSMVATYEASTGFLDVTAYDKDQVTTVSLYIDLNGPTTQTIGSDAFGNVQVSSTTEGLYQGTSGMLTITSNNKTAKTVEGTFEFQAVNSNQASINITGGKFYVDYSK